MSNIKVGSAAYKSILARVNWLRREQEKRVLTAGEFAELQREDAKLEAAELEHHAAQQGAHA